VCQPAQVARVSVTVQLLLSTIDDRAAHDVDMPNSELRNSKSQNRTAAELHDRGTATATATATA
jgi:hypothetical protein